jgi:hypothetical protein
VRQVTKRQAEQVLAHVKRTFRPYCEAGGDGPSLRMDFDWSGAGARPAIVWEGGPFEWAYLAASGGVDEEMTTLAMELPEYVQFVRTGKMKHPVRVEPIAGVPGVFVEPITSWALGLYVEGE